MVTGLTFYSVEKIYKCFLNSEGEELLLSVELYFTLLISLNNMIDEIRIFRRCYTDGMRFLISKICKGRRLKINFKEHQES